MANHTHTFNLDTFNSAAAINDLFDREAAMGDLIDPMRDHMANQPSWFGCASTDDLASVIATGDRATTARVQRAISSKEIAQVPAAFAIKPVLRSRRATGQRFDLERVLDGDPLPWSRWESRKASGSKIVSLYLPMGGNVNLSAEQIGWAPVAGIVVADVLESAGYRVEIWAGDRSSDRGLGSQTGRFSVKSADATLDLNGIARVAHPSVTRGIVFAQRALAVHARSPTTNFCGHGSTQELDPSVFGEPDSIGLMLCYNLPSTVREISRVLSKFV